MESPTSPAPNSAKVLVPKLPALGTPLVYFVHVLSAVEFAKRVQQKHLGNKFPLACRGDVNETFVVEMENFLDFGYLTMTQEFEDAGFTHEAVHKYEGILVDVVLSGMWNGKSQRFWEELDAKNPGQGVLSFPQEQRDRIPFLLSQRSRFKRYCTAKGAWFLIDIFNGIINDDGYDAGEVSDDPGDSEEVKERKARHRFTVRKNKFATYLADPETYKRERNAVKAAMKQEKDAAEAEDRRRCEVLNVEVRKRREEEAQLAANLGAISFSDVEMGMEEGGYEEGGCYEEKGSYEEAEAFEEDTEMIDTEMMLD